MFLEAPPLTPPHPHALALSHQVSSHMLMPFAEVPGLCSLSKNMSLTIVDLLGLVLLIIVIKQLSPGCSLCTCISELLLAWLSISVL